MTTASQTISTYLTTQTEPSTVPALMAATGLSKTAVVNSIKALVAQGTVVQVGSLQTGRRGRPAHTFRMAPAPAPTAE